MSKRPLFIIFALFASVSISASIIPSNGADYIAIIAIKRAFPENQIARQISKLELKELELEELQAQLSKTGIQSEIKVSGFLEVINALNNDQLLVCEIIPTTDSSVSQMALIERQTDKFYIFSLFKYAKAQISPEELFTNFKNRLTNRFLIITPKIHRLGLTIENERQRSSENESITNDRRFSEWLHGDSLSIPSLINLGSVPTGGVLIPINIPIENKSKDAVRIFSTVTQCSCIKGSSCPPEIQEHAIGIFHLKLSYS